LETRTQWPAIPFNPPLDAKDQIVMSKPIVVDTDIKLPNQDKDISVSLQEKGAVHVGFGIDLFLGPDLVRHVVAFPDEDDIDNPFPLDSAIALRGMNLDCFGRVFSAEADNVQLWLVFSIGNQEVASSGIAKIPLTASDATREFHLRCNFV
jgi:hypothetical protein